MMIKIKQNNVYQAQNTMSLKKQPLIVAHHF